MTRLQAFAIHLGCSLLLVGLVAGWLLWVWYPGPLFELEDGWQGLGLVALLLLVLGPLLTLILFKPGKAGLGFDLWVIALLQVGALALGIWQLNQARPVLLVHAADHFKPLSHTLLAQWDPSGALLRQWAGLTPQWLQVALPDDPVAFAALEAANRARPGELHALSERYRPLAAGWPQLLQDATDIRAYVRLDPELERALAACSVRLGRPVEELAFFPYVGRRQRVFLVFERATRTLLGVLDIPFEPVLVRPEVPRIERVGLSRAVADG